MLAYIEFDRYGSDMKKVLEAIDREKWAALRRAMPGIFSEWKEDVEKQPDIEWYWEHMIDLVADGAALAENKLEFKVKRFKGAYFVKDTAAVSPSTNITIQVAIPAIGLMEMDEVDWMDDACTKELQSRLDEGWRIIAVCPPDAQRRPTYIIGRSPATGSRRALR